MSERLQEMTIETGLFRTIKNMRDRPEARGAAITLKR
jgi:hypothetical protein